MYYIIKPEHVLQPIVIDPEGIPIGHIKRLLCECELTEGGEKSTFTAVSVNDVIKTVCGEKLNFNLSTKAGFSIKTVNGNTHVSFLGQKIGLIKRLSYSSSIDRPPTLNLEISAI